MCVCTRMQLTIRGDAVTDPVNQTDCGNHVSISRPGLMLLHCRTFPAGKQWLNCDQRSNNITRMLVSVWSAAPVT